MRSSSGQQPFVWKQRPWHGSSGVNTAIQLDLGENSKGNYLSGSKLAERGIIMSSFFRSSKMDSSKCTEISLNDFLGDFMDCLTK